MTITARGPNGEPIRDVQLRAEIIVKGKTVEFGTLSPRITSTIADGTATMVYTPPPPVAGAPVEGTVVTIGVTPIGTDFGNAALRTAQLLLVRLTTTATASNPIVP